MLTDQKALARHRSYPDVIDRTGRSHAPEILKQAAAPAG